MRFLVTAMTWGRKHDGGPPPIRQREIVSVESADDIPAWLERAHGARLMSCTMQPLPEVDPILRREILQRAIAKAGSSTKLAKLVVREDRHIRRMLAGDSHIADAVLIKCQEVINNGS